MSGNLKSGISLILVLFPKICHHLCCEAAAEMQQLVMCVTLSQIMSSVCLFTSFPLDEEFSHCFWEFRCEEISWSIFICVVALHTLCHTMVENCLKNPFSKKSKVPKRKKKSTKKCRFYFFLIFLQNCLAKKYHIPLILNN